MIANTAFPNGATGDDLKKFISDNFEQFGITEDSVKITDEQIQKAIDEYEKVMQDAIETSGESEGETDESSEETSTEETTESESE